jgi:hypothetical protein
MVIVPVVVSDVGMGIISTTFVAAATWRTVRVPPLAVRLPTSFDEPDKARRTYVPVTVPPVHVAEKVTK